MAYRKERYWSQFARNYDEDAEFVVGKSLREAIAGKLRQERGLGEVAEFGCGTGYFTQAIAEYAECVIATDLSEEMLEAARNRLNNFRNVTFQKEDSENLSLPSSRFDTVVMANVLHTVEHPARALEESRRVLRDGGRLLVVSYTSYGTNWFELMELAFRYFQKFGWPPNYYRNYSPDELVSLVENAGFTVEEIRVISDTAKALYLKARKK